jgi:hypothetical protein
VRLKRKRSPEKLLLTQKTISERKRKGFFTLKEKKVQKIQEICYKKKAKRRNEWGIGDTVC